MRLNPKYLMLFSDALIPILGFFVWDWSLYFILLFYIIDLLAREVITHVKTRKIYSDQGLKKRSKWIRNGLISAVLLLLVFILVHVAVFFIQPGIHFIKEVQLFWAYKELGVQQGYLLVPLVGYAAYAQYKMQFLMTGKSRKVLVDTLWGQHIKALIFMLIGSVLGIMLAYFASPPELLYVLAIVIGAGAFSYFLEKV